MNGKPVVVIAHTVKGRGLPEAEFNYHWHTHAPSPKQADAFLAGQLNLKTAVPQGLAEPGRRPPRP